MLPASSTLPDHPEIFIGRQPIFDRDMRVVAYELLYRNGAGNYAELSCQETATSQVIVNSFLDIGFDRLVGNLLAYINVPRGLLLGQDLMGLPPEKVVLEVLEDIKPDQAVHLALQRLRKAGFQIALDDFVFTDDKAGLVASANIIKIDLRALTTEQVQRQVTILKRQGLVLLAEKVETKQEYLNCRNMGFDLFQGYYFCRPEVIKGTKAPSNQLAILQLLTRLYDPDVSLAELEKLVSQDVSLSFKLLKVVNSASMSIQHKIESIKQAITMLGVQKIRHWVAFITFSGIKDKPFELSKLSMLRAKMCELVAAEISPKSSEKCFTIGLFSSLDAMLDRPMEDLLDSLPLTDDIKSALLRREGQAGAILDCVLQYEQGNWDKLTCLSVSASSLRRCYLTALEWAESASREV